MTHHINPGTDTTINPVIINDTHRQKQPVWIYKREPAGMGEWCYRIYRNNHYMLYAE